MTTKELHSCRLTVKADIQKSSDFTSCSLPQQTDLIKIFMFRVVCNALDDAIEEKKNDKTISTLQLQVSESCKNIQRLHENNPGIVTSIRSELSGAYAHKGGPELGEALRMIEGLYGKLDLF